MFAIAATAGVLVACGDDASRPAGGVDAGAPGARSLYQRLGGKTGLESLVKTVVETKLAAPTRRTERSPGDGAPAPCACASRRSRA